MRWLATLAVVVVLALMSPTTASGQNYTFGDWARDQGYSPGDVMPGSVNADCYPSCSRKIDSLNGIGDFDWTTTPTTSLNLGRNQISSIEPRAFSGLTNLVELELYYIQISSIESGDFSGLANLSKLLLQFNQLSSIESGDFSGLTNLSTLHLNGNQISSIKSSAFESLTRLNILWLDHNQISSVESDTFTGLTDLNQLDLGYNQLSSIESGDISGLTNLSELWLNDNQIPSIESGDFSGLTRLSWLNLMRNQVSSIESGAFSGLTDLRGLYLEGNTVLTELNLEAADFSMLFRFDVEGNVNITSVSLRNAVLNDTSLAALLDGGISDFNLIGIGGLDGITEMDLSGVDFIDITYLDPLYVMDDLTDLWLVDTLNLDASDLDALLDDLTTIEGASTEGILYMTQADFDGFDTAGGGLLTAWNAEPGHHVEFVVVSLPGDINLDGEVNGLDVDPFLALVTGGTYQPEADMNDDQVINGLDVDSFVAAVVGGDTHQIPEPSTRLLAMLLVALAGTRSLAIRSGVR